MGRKKKTEEIVETPASESTKAPEKLNEPAENAEPIPNAVVEGPAEKEPSLMDGYEPGEKTEPEAPPKSGQQCFDTENGELVPAPVATITHKPRAVPIEIKLANNKFKLNTTEEGLEGAKEKDRSELRAWVIPKIKVLKDATINEGDFDAAVETMIEIIEGDAVVNEVEGGKGASVAQ